MTVPGDLAPPSSRAPAADGPPTAVDPSAAGFRALALQVRTMGLLDRRPGYYGLKIALTILVFLAAWVLFVIVGNSWTTLAVAALAGFAFTQLGFIGHDAGHNQVFGTRRRNRLLGLAVGNGLIGLSFGWWVHKHNAHHAHPNEVGRDPDVGAGVPLAALDTPENGRRPLEVWMARWQAPLFFPLMLLRSGGMHVLGVKRLLRQRDRAAAVEGSLIALHAALYLTVVLLVLSPVKALAFIAVQQAVFSVYLGFSFAPNHKGMPLIETGDGDQLRPPAGGHGPEYHRRPVHRLHARRPQLPDRASPVPLDAPAQPAAGPGPGQGLLRGDRAGLQRGELRRVVPPDRPSPQHRRSGAMRSGPAARSCRTRRSR